MRESEVLASQRQEVTCQRSNSSSELKTRSELLHWRLESKTHNRDVSDSYHPLPITPFRKPTRACLGNSPAPSPPRRSPLAFPPSAQSPAPSPAPSAASVPPGAAGSTGGLRQPAGGCGGRAKPMWAGAAETAGRPLPPQPAPSPRRQPAPLGGRSGSGASGMLRGAGAGPRRRWLLLVALLWALCCAAAGGGGRRRAASLGEMLREVEALMEDTQHKLRNAVQEVRGRQGGLGGWGLRGGWGEPLPPSLTTPSRAGQGRTCGQRQPLARGGRFLRAAASPLPRSGAGGCDRGRRRLALPALLREEPLPAGDLRASRRGERGNPFCSVPAARPPGAAALPAGRREAPREVPPRLLALFLPSVLLSAPPLAPPAMGSPASLGIAVCGTGRAGR